MFVPNGGRDEIDPAAKFHGDLGQGNASAVSRGSQPWETAQADRHVTTCRVEAEKTARTFYTMLPLFDRNTPPKA
jgi:hypothetical protein